jgi:hypothetical protein
MRYSIGGGRWHNVFLLKSFFQNFVYCVLFFKGHGISLALEGLGGVRSEGDNMVPFAMGGELLSCFLAEYFGMMVIGRGDEFRPVFLFLPFSFFGCEVG